ncbi:suprabasin isoform X2 [Globicephala melas]|uniref:suprabasin isoform X2 n=1 Tax=Globicephala melas TaxID=9731 RepID=UPI00293D1FF4|nr:suprabasin isoform X2 [Globicephala melas]
MTLQGGVHGLEESCCAGKEEPGGASVMKHQPGSPQGRFTHQNGGAATTTLTSGALVNKPFIDLSVLWKSLTNIIL